MPRFFIDRGDINGNTVFISGEDAEHIRVLRMKPGEDLVLCDGEGTEYECRILSTEEKRVEAEILKNRRSETEPDIFCSIYTAFSKGERMESAIQKAVELGACEIVPFPSARCIPHFDGGAPAGKRLRWQKIATEAAKQCNRGRIPKVTPASSFESALKDAAAAQMPLFFYEEDRTLPLKAALESRQGYKTVSIVTGPEGGFEPCEAERARELGFFVASLGPRILRCETAPVCALSAVMFHAGEL